MYEGGCISHVFHFKMVKNYVIFVLTAEVGLSILGMLLIGWFGSLSPQRTAGAFLRCCFKSLSPQHFPSILPAPSRPLLFIWGFVFLSDKNETHAGHKARISWLGRGGQIRRERKVVRKHDWLSQLPGEASGHILVSKSEGYVCTQPRSLPQQKAILSLILA